MDRESVITAVTQELNRATSLHGLFVSPHEGWAILREEVDELWDEIKRKPSRRSIERMREEATQVAAMAMRFMEDLC